MFTLKTLQACKPRSGSENITLLEKAQYVHTPRHKNTWNKLKKTEALNAENSFHHSVLSEGQETAQKKEENQPLKNQKQKSASKNAGEEKDNRRSKGDTYHQGFICLFEILSIVTIKLQFLTEILQS